jgi:hypothetical protein
VHLFPSICSYGHHFHTEDANDVHITQYCGMDIDFDQSSHARHHDQNLIEWKLGYIGKIQEIMQWTSNIFNVLFLVASGGIPLTGEM